MTDVGVISKPMTTARSKQALRRSVGSLGAMSASSSAEGNSSSSSDDRRELRSATSGRVVSATKSRRASLDHSILGHPTNFSSPLSARKPNSRQHPTNTNGFHHSKEDLLSSNNYHNRPKTTGYRAKKSQQSTSTYDSESSDIASGLPSVQITAGNSLVDNENEETDSTMDASYPPYTRATSSLDIIDREMQSIRDRTLTRCRRDPPRGSQQFENLMHEFQKKLDVDSDESAERESFDKVDTLAPQQPVSSRRRRLSWNPEISVQQISRISELD
jgi:hypothetical protein